MDETNNTAPEATNPEMEAANTTAPIEEGATEADPTMETTPTEETAPEAAPAPEATPEM